MLKEEALRLLEREGCSEDIITHVCVVSEHALAVARRINSNGGSVDAHVVEIGGLLHDVGRSKTNSVFHGIEGAKILRKYGADPVFIDICETHLGSGIDEEEAVRLGLPRKEYIPHTIEGRLIAYIDNRVIDGRLVGFEEALDQFKNKIKNKRSIERFIEMNEEFGEYL